MVNVMKNNSIKEVEILLVEDTEPDAHLIFRLFKRYNIYNKVSWVTDGQEALDFIFATGIYNDRLVEIGPKIILLDINLPKVSGIEVLRRIKADERTKNIPIIMLSSSNEPEDINICYKYGANSYVSKPVEFDEFTKKLTALGLYWLLINQSANEAAPKISISANPYVHLSRETLARINKKNEEKLELTNIENRRASVTLVMAQNALVSRHV